MNLFRITPLLRACILLSILISLFQLPQTSHAYWNDDQLDERRQELLSPNSLSGIYLPDQTRFINLNVEHGLSQSSVLCILQDDQGFLWFGTEDGLNRFDGYDLTIYRHDMEDPNSLTDNNISALFYDRDGYIWVGTTGGGVDRFDPINEKFEHIQSDKEGLENSRKWDIRTIAQDTDGNLWFGTLGEGLYRYNQSTQEFSKYFSDEANKNGLINNYVFKLFVDQAGNLWVGTAIGLQRYLPEENRFNLISLSELNDSSKEIRVYDIAEASGGILWLATNKGLHKLKVNDGTLKSYFYDPEDPTSLSAPSVLAVRVSSAGDVWIGTNGGGLNYLPAGENELRHFNYSKNNAYSLSNDYIRSIYIDQSGMVWIGTFGGGVNKMVPAYKRFYHFYNKPDDPGSLSHNFVFAITEDEAGFVWIGTLGGGLNRFDPETGQSKHFLHDPEDKESLISSEVWAVLSVEDDIWVGTSRGLSKFDPKTQKSVNFTHNPEDKTTLSSNPIYSLVRTPDGSIWVGTANGLNRLDESGDGFTRYLHDEENPDSISEGDVWSLFVDRDGVLWVGTNGGGIQKYDSETDRFIHFRNDPDNPDSLSDDSVLGITQDRSGIFWIGTWGGGLNRFDPQTGSFQHYSIKDGLPNDTIYAIHEDQNGYLWMSTNRGLSRFDPRTGIFRNYSRVDGLQGEEFNINASHHAKSGLIYFGGINGLTVFDPSQIQNNPNVPNIVITSFSQFNQVVQRNLTDGDSLELGYKENFISFDFVALDFLMPEQNEYAYRLEGLDPDWVYAGNRRHADYPNLSPGDYVFRVKGSNSDGVWNEAGVSLKVTIKPPFWGTWWFQSLAVLVVGMTLVAGYRVRVNGIEKRAKELEKEVQARTVDLKHRNLEIERRRQELEALYWADEELYRNLDLDQVLQALVDASVRILGADKGALMVWNEKKERLVARAVRGFNAETIPKLSFKPGEGVAGRVAVEGQPVIVEDARINPSVNRSVVDQEGICSFMQVPIMVGGEIFGVFSADYTTHRTITQANLDLLVSLADRAALAIQNAQIHEQTQHTAVIEERSRLARELHDAVTQTLFSASLIAEALPACWDNDPEEGRQLLNELRQLSRGALAEMRTLLLELRPSALSESNLGDLLRQLGEAVNGREGIDVKLSVNGRCNLPPDVHIAFYRIAQEAMNNIARHALANQVEVKLSYVPLDKAGSNGVNCSSAQLSIFDNGRGFLLDEIPTSHLGISIMQERAQSIGGELLLNSEPGKGTHVTVKWENQEVNLEPSIPLVKLAKR